MSFAVIPGSAGTLLYLVNRALISLSAPYEDRCYFAGNLIAASAVAVSSLMMASWQASAINLVWAVISLRRLRGNAVDVPISGPRIILVLAVAAAIALVLRPAAVFAIFAWLSVAVFALACLLFASGGLGRHGYMWLNAYAATTMTPQLWLDRNFPVPTLDARA